jgi:lysophospholipase L1-like esterase
VRFDHRFNELAKEISMLELAEDGVHPSKLGHTIMADLWLDTVGL